MGEEKKKKRKHLKTWTFFYFAALVLLYLVIYAYPKVTGALTPTMIVSYDELKVWDQVTCWFVRSETVVSAEKGGAVNYYIPEGTMTRKGTKVLDVNPASGGAIKAYPCAENGVVSYYIDGYEGYFTPEIMSKLTEEDVKQRDKNPENTMRQSALAGEPLYKLVDNSVWYAVYWVDQSGIAKYKKDSSVTLELPMGSVQGTISDIVNNGDKWLIILKFNKYYEDMPKVRSVEATVITEDYKGLLIPNESMITVDGVLGVYVKTISGEYKFLPVNVITTDGENSLVSDTYFYRKLEDGKTKKEDTIGIYDEILKNGKSFKGGQEDGKDS